jgi:LysR family hydrogen peroxide-inducible transcriptional activator
LPGLRRAYGRLKLYLVEDLTARLIEGLHQGRLDVVLLALPYDCGAVDTFVLFDDPLLVALPREHELAKEARIRPQQLLKEDLLLLKDGHCLREHALSACNIANRIQDFEATSLPTLVQMVDNRLGITLLPALAVEAGLLLGTSLVVRRLLDNKARKVGLVWRSGTGRQNELRLLAKEISDGAKKPTRSHQNSDKTTEKISRISR